MANSISFDAQDSDVNLEYDFKMSCSFQARLVDDSMNFSWCQKSPFLVWHHFSVGEKTLVPLLRRNKLEHIIGPACFGGLTANILYFHKFVKIEAEITLLKLHFVHILPHIATEYCGFYHVFGRF